MKQISLTDLKKMLVEDIKRQGCVEITANGESLGILVVGAQGGMKNTIEGFASQIEAARPKEV